MASQILAKKYINLISVYLDHFSWKDTSLANVRCFLCGDSKKNEIKARGYFYLSKNNRWRYKCHNCSCNFSLHYVLKNHYPQFYKEYVAEFLADSDQPREPSKLTGTNAISDVYVPRKKINFSGANIHTLTPNHHAKAYIRNRHIPSAYHKILYYTDSFSSWVGEVQTGFDLDKHYDIDKLPNDERILIPFYDQNGKPTMVQGRALDPNCKMRYITCKFFKDAKKLYGMERYDTSKEGYIVEGPFDSLLLPNCMAVAGSDMPTQKLNKVTYIFDNEPRNIDICNNIQRAIDLENKVCIWEPETEVTNGKDITDMYDTGMNQKQVMEIINSRTFSGVSAKLEFSQWKRC